MNCRAAPCGLARARADARACRAWKTSAVLVAIWMLGAAGGCSRHGPADSSPTTATAPAEVTQDATLATAALEDALEDLEAARAEPAAENRDATPPAVGDEEEVEGFRAAWFAPSREDSEVEFDGWYLDYFDCAAEGPRRRLSLPRVALDSPVVRRIRFIGPGTRAEVAISSDDDAEADDLGWTMRAAWAGEDDRGAYRGVSQPSAVAVTQPGDDSHYRESTPWRLRGAWRTGALFERIPDESVPELLWASADGGVSLIWPTAPEDDPDEEFQSAVPAGDENVALLLRTTEDADTAVDRPGEVRDIVLLVDPAGRVVWRDEFTWTPYMTLGALGRHGASIGYVGPRPDDPSLLQWTPLGDATAPTPLDFGLAWSDAEPAPLCTRPPDEDGLELFDVALKAEESLYSSSGDLELVGPDVTGDVQVDGRGACIRRLGASDGTDADASGFRLTAAGPRSLTGFVDDAEGRLRLRCVPGEAPGE